MATLTPTLTLASADTSDELQFTITDELGIKAPSQNMSTYIAADNVGANNIVVPTTGGLLHTFTVDTLEQQTGQQQQ